jgi:uncharacterized repeat protein (TIGR01451 family)
MMKNVTVGCLALMLAVLAPAAAMAQKPAEPLESRLDARKVVLVDGRESLVDAAAVRPGDLIEYVATYRNTGKGAITGLQATVPIPPQTEFVPGSARPAQAQASVDGRNFAAIPLKRTVTRAGKQIEEQVPFREYRALRWFAGELVGGSTAAFTARVRVIDDRAPSEPGSKGGGK